MSISGNAAVCGAALALGLGLICPAAAMDAVPAGSSQQASQTIDFPLFFDGSRLPDLRDLFSAGQGKETIAAPYRLGAPIEDDPITTGAIDEAAELHLERTEAVITKSQDVRRRAEELSRRFTAEGAEESVESQTAKAALGPDAVQGDESSAQHSAVRLSEPTDGERASRDMSKLIPAPSLPVRAPSSRRAEGAVAEGRVGHAPPAGMRKLGAQVVPQAVAQKGPTTEAEPKRETKAARAMPTELHSFGWDAYEVLE